MTVFDLIFIPDLHHNLSWEIHPLISWLVNKMAEISSRAPCWSMKQPARNSSKIFGLWLLKLSQCRRLKMWLWRKNLASHCKLITCNRNYLAVLELLTVKYIRSQKLRLVIIKWHARIDFLDLRIFVKEEFFGIFI